MKLKRFQKVKNTYKKIGRRLGKAIGKTQKH